jgi:hypothetical protein
MCLGVDGTLTRQGVRSRNYFNGNLTNVLPHWDPLYGTQNQPCNSSLSIINAYGFKIKGFPSTIIWIFF